MYVTTLHEYFTLEYTLSAMLAGTYSVALVPVAQGRVSSFPKASSPMRVRLLGRMMVDNELHSWKVPWSKETTDVGMLMLDNLLQD